MAAVYHTEGKLLDLDRIVDVAFTGNWRLRLFQNDFDPVETDDVSAFTEATYSGYSQQTVTWGPGVLNGDDNAQKTALLNLFSHDGGGTANDVFGWYLVDTTGGGEVMLHSERLVSVGSPGIPMANLGDNVQITPRKIQGSCPLVP